MIYFFSFFSLLVHFIGFSQLPQTKEISMFGIKNKDNYTLIRMSIPDNKAVVYKLTTDQTLEFVKKYDNDIAFEKDYASLEKLSQSKNEELVTAFYKNNNLHEVTSQKRSLEDYNEQTIRIYKIENNIRALIATYHELQFLRDSPHSEYIFIN